MIANILLFCAIVILAYLVNKFVFLKINYLKENRISAAAIVTEITKTNIRAGRGALPIRVYELKLELTDKSFIQKTVSAKQAFDPLNVPNIGDKILIWIDPKDLTKAMIQPGLNTSGVAVNKTASTFEKTTSYTTVKQKSDNIDESV